MAPSPNIAPKKELLRKVFDDLDAQGAAIARCSQSWKELDQHLSQIEESLQKRLEEVAEKEKAFEARIKESQAALDKRDGAVATREQASLARVQEQKDAAIASIMEQRRKWLEEHQGEGVNGGAVPKGAVDANVKSEQETAVKKEEEQEEEEEEEEVEDEEPAEEGMEVEEAGSKPAEEGNEGEEAAETKGGSSKKEEKDAPEPATVRARPQLRSLCENMDGTGLRKYVAEQKKEINALRSELPSALRCAIDPAKVVLKALEGYHSTDLPSGPGKKKETGPPSNRRSCILLLESLADVLADPLLAADQPAVPSNIKVSAKEVADLWKTKLDPEAKDAVALLDTQSFLQLLATFGLASEFDEDELCKFVMAILRRKQTPALCRSLGLGAKVPGVVEQLIKDGKQIEALSFAHEFGLFEQFPPVPLLKAYLKDARKTAQALKRGNQSSAQNEHLLKELSAIKAVLKCIDEYELEAEYPTEGLQKRVAQLEKAKFDKKRTADAAKFQSKKPRVNGAGGPAFRPSDRQGYGGGGAPYGSGSRNYGPGYGGGARSPRSLAAAAYPYPSDGLGSLYSNPSFSYGAYPYGAGPPYQGSFLR